MRFSIALILAAATLAACSGEGAEAPESSQEPAMSPAPANPGSSDAYDLVGAWTLEYVGDRPVIDRSPAYIQFDAEGGVSGSASCNRMSGGYTVEGSALTLTPMAVTRMACLEVLSEQESRVLAALDRVASWRIQDGMLMLEDADGGPVFRASPRQDEAGEGA